MSERVWGRERERERITERDTDHGRVVTVRALGKDQHILVIPEDWKLHACETMDFT